MRGDAEAWPDSKREPEVISPRLSYMSLIAYHVNGLVDRVIGLV